VDPIAWFVRTSLFTAHEKTHPSSIGHKNMFVEKFSLMIQQRMAEDAQRLSGASQRSTIHLMNTGVQEYYAQEVSCFCSLFADVRLRWYEGAFTFWQMYQPNVPQLTIIDVSTRILIRFDRENPNAHFKTTDSHLITSHAPVPESFLLEPHDQPPDLS
jgi:hypothetical protein